MHPAFVRASVRSWALSTILVVAGCAASASVGPAPAGMASAVTVNTAAAPPVVPPATAEACQACNGAWGKHGLAQSESCNCRTTDAGKRCKDGAECQGVCVAADEPEREVTDAGPPPRGHFVGTCSATITVFGCFKPIDKGAARAPVLLSEPPPSLCVD